MNLRLHSIPVNIRRRKKDGIFEIGDRVIVMSKVHGKIIARFHWIKRNREVFIIETDKQYRLYTRKEFTSVSLRFGVTMISSIAPNMSHEPRGYKKADPKNEY